MQLVDLILEQSNKISALQTEVKKQKVVEKKAGKTSPYENKKDKKKDERIDKLTETAYEEAKLQLSKDKPTTAIERQTSPCFSEIAGRRDTEQTQRADVP